MTTQTPAEPGPATPSSVDPQLATSGRASRRSNRLFVLVGLFVAFLLAGFVSGFASGSPDGLERVATDKGFADAADDHSLAWLPIADYAVSGVANERLAGGLAGIIGVTITFAVGSMIIFAVLSVRSRRERAGSADTTTGSVAVDASAASSR